jgi:hypothetical protein
MNIVEFLDARIAEDEAVASLLSKGDAGHSPRTEVYTGTEWVTTPLTTDRLLAECKAKRAIIERAIEIHDMIDGEWGGGHEVSKEGWQDDNPGTEVVQALAAVYADHSEYRQEWV